MSLGVLNNISAIYAQNNLNKSQSSLQKTLQQLSSGSRINSGADDAAGLSLSDALNASATALSQSAKNASEGVDFLQVADGAMSQITSLLNRAVTLATEAANGTLNGAQLSATQAEYSSIMNEIDTISSNTEYNGINVFSKAVSVFTSDGTVASSYSSSAVGRVDSSAIGLATQVLVGGNNHAAGTAGVDSLGNAYTATDRLVTISGKDYAVGTSTAQDIAINGSKVWTLGNAQYFSGTTAQIPVGGGGGKDALNTTINDGDYVFTDTASGKKYDLGATGSTAITTIKLVATTNTVTASTPAEASSSLSFYQATAAQNGSTDANGTTIQTGHWLLTDSKGNVFDMGATKTSGTAAITLSTQTGAKAALNQITQAISGVAAARGTAGAAINTLEAVGSVMSTQSTNVLSAQNDVVATDYGTATSDLSKYQILMQTGISALAQANSTQQLVTKLLQ